MNRFVVLAGLLALAGCESVAAQAVTGPAPGGVTRAGADLAAERRGAAYAAVHCAGCHAVGRRGDSPLAAAPPFRSLGLRYPVTDLAEAFAEGIVTAHPAMPRFVLATDENAALIAYLQSIQAPAAR